MTLTRRGSSPAPFRRRAWLIGVGTSACAIWTQSGLSESLWLSPKTCVGVVASDVVLPCVSQVVWVSVLHLVSVDVVFVWDVV